MLSHHVFYLLFSIFYFTNGQSTTIRIGIIDDNYNRADFVTVKVPYITFCGRKGLNFELQWFSTTDSLPVLINKLETEQNHTNIYLANTNKLHTDIIRDFSHTHNILFINMKPYGSKTTACSTTTFVITIFSLFRLRINFIDFLLEQLFKNTLLCRTFLMY